MTADLLGFVHIPKSGGSSLRSAFSAAGFRVWRPRGARYTLRLTPPDLADVDVVTGHIPLVVFARLPVTRWAILLRDPAERWISHYLAECGPEWPPRTWPPVGVVPPDLAARLLTLDGPDLFSGDVDADRTLEALQQFDHVGRTERIAETFAALGLAPVHERPSKARPDDLPGWLTDAAIESNVTDLAVLDALTREGTL